MNKYEESGSVCVGGVCSLLYVSTLKSLLCLSFLKEIHHSRRQIKYSKDKMWYLAKMVRSTSRCFAPSLKKLHKDNVKANYLFFPSFRCLAQIRGMSIDEAIAQLEFNDKKGAKIMKEVCS